MEQKIYTPEEQRENRKKWVEALRSGKYKQAKERLKTEDGGFCCLGVACEVSGLGEWDNDGRYLHQQSWLPQEVQGWLGVRVNSGTFLCDGALDSLSRLNDRGNSFLEIADIIESEPEGLFDQGSSS